MLRNDIALEIMHASILIRAINGRLVASRDFPDFGPMGANKYFPENGVLFRGTGFRDEFQHFFTGSHVPCVRLCLPKPKPRAALFVVDVTT